MFSLKLTNIFNSKMLLQGPEGAEFNITWKPKIIDPEKFVQIHFNFIARKTYLQQCFDISN